ncbi:unnamed protein product [Lasius platythorax]|uniref:Uncharacterized protein n=1 Tax=Lasius platythorax TaxID=488582 RepID=A0AAV2NWI7_9HYME
MTTKGIPNPDSDCKTKPVQHPPRRLIIEHCGLESSLVNVTALINAAPPTRTRLAMVPSQVGFETQTSVYRGDKEGAKGRKRERGMKTWRVTQLRFPNLCLDAQLAES